MEKQKLEKQDKKNAREEINRQPKKKRKERISIYKKPTIRIIAINSRKLQPTKEPPPKVNKKPQ